MLAGLRGRNADTGFVLPVVLGDNAVVGVIDDYTRFLTSGFGRRAAWSLTTLHVEVDRQDDVEGAVASKVSPRAAALRWSRWSVGAFRGQSAFLH